MKILTALSFSQKLWSTGKFVHASQQCIFQANHCFCTLMLRSSVLCLLEFLALNPVNLPIFAWSKIHAYMWLIVCTLVQVHGGVDLRLTTKSHASHRRVPSDEALLRMAAHHKVSVPDPKKIILSSTLSAPLTQSYNLAHHRSIVNGGESSKLRTPNLENGLAGSEGKEEKGEKEKVSQIPSGDSVNIQKQAEANAVFGER